ncbi:ATP-binding cassette subfamily B protein [Fontibacillus solani]|uniref:ATP-binding cassette subfamily B protein n=1 Tax=Fontibacillus solani TaxID=1572857 RepID=A0A7W3XT12_9BACL|nr:ABC transporter ATP-binding protein [Fontibacillus solani]MBA9087110.1 ATP-binding cassette subfamily B protein [Fontibacillus solani]
MKNIRLFRAFITMLPKIVRVSPGLFSVWMISAIVQGIIIGLLAPVMQLFFDRATDYATGKAGLPFVVVGLVLLGAFQVGRNAINGFVYFCQTIYYQKADGILSMEVHDKINKIAPICFEDTRILDDMNKALQGKKETVLFTGNLLNTFTFYLPYFVIMSVYLFRVKPILVVSLVLIFVPVFLTQIFRMKIFAKAEDKSAPIRRKVDYYESCMSGREYFKETRILGAFPYFRKLYADSLALLNKLRFRAATKSDLTQFGVQMLSLGGNVGILLLLLDGLMKEEISVGAFAAIFASVDTMFKLMGQLISDKWGAIARDFGRVQYYLRFLQMPERGGMDVEMPADVDIALRDVSFAYPNATRNAVEDVSLTIKDGETIALVGENGSGKTTLVRLITGLYLPDEGEVLYGEASTGEVSMASLFKNTSAVFQKFQRYQMTLRENVDISDVDAMAGDADLDAISVQSGLDKDDRSFSNGYDTMLSREFDGVDLSGGQWQRIAIARAFFRRHKLIVLDEPTAAIDPIEETKVYKRFAEISRDKTAIIVTHRLGSVKLAGRIMVMKQGRLVEQGTHEELISHNGEYARLYQSQEQWYKN